MTHRFDPRCTATLGRSRPRGKSNEEVLHTPSLDLWNKSHIIRFSLVLYPGHSSWGGRLKPQRILNPTPRSTAFFTRARFWTWHTRSIFSHQTLQGQANTCVCAHSSRKGHIFHWKRKENPRRQVYDCHYKLDIILFSCSQSFLKQILLMQVEEPKFLSFVSILI